MHCLYFVLLALVFTVHSALSEPFEKIVGKCKNDIGFDGDVLNINYNNPEFPHKAKCVMACVLGKMGVIKEDGSIDKVKEKAIPEEIIKDENEKKLYLKAIDECDVPAKANNCETAYEFLKCIHNKAKGH